MKTIYFYGIDNNRGGMETYALNLIRGILAKSNDYKFHILSIFENFAFKNEFTNELKCDYTILPNPKKHPLKYQKQLIKTLKQASKNDIFHVNIMSYRNFLLMHSIKKSKMKTIIVGHSIETNSVLKRVMHKFGKVLYGKYGTKVGMNNRVLGFMFSKKDRDLNIISNGIEIEKFLFNSDIRKRIRSENKIDSNVFAIGQIGRISKQKNQMFTCEVAKKLTNTNIQFYFFGNDQFSMVKNKIKKEKINNIHIMGQVNNISEIYNAFDLLIMPSIFEAGSLALYEGLANKCETIISPHVPADKIDSDYLQIAELNVDEWVKIIMLKSKQYSGRNLAQKNNFPTIEEHISEYLKLYNRL